MAKKTDIVLSGFGLPDYACRGVDVEVGPIQEAKQYMASKGIAVRTLG